jgi:hypothetical protein
MEVVMTFKDALKRNNKIIPNYRPPMKLSSTLVLARKWFNWG